MRVEVIQPLPPARTPHRQKHRRPKYRLNTGNGLLNVYEEDGLPGSRYSTSYSKVGP
jgi:hypothetical protein